MAGIVSGQRKGHQGGLTQANKTNEVSHISYLISHISYLISHISYLISHISYLISHISYLISHISYLISHISYLTSHARPGSLLTRKLLLVFIFAGVAGIAGFLTPTVNAEREDEINLGDISAQTQPQFLRDTLDETDEADYYRFTLSAPKHVHIALRRQETNADLFLEDADATVLHSSTESGTANETIRATLLAGTYYVRLEAQETGDSTYVFRYGVTEPEAEAVSELHGRQRGYEEDLDDITDQEEPLFLTRELDGDTDVVDYYRFTLTEPKEVGLGLQQQETNADLFLEDADATVLHSSTESGTANETIRATLLAGTYYVRLEAQETGGSTYVFRYGVSEPDAVEVERLSSTPTAEQPAEPEDTTPPVTRIPRGVKEPETPLVPSPQVARGDVATDRTALMALYNSTGGASWTNNTNWDTNAALNTWHGVTTRTDGRVIVLNLRSNDLVGTIPASLGNLDTLAELNLRGNELSGPIPTELGNLASLSILELDGNPLSGSIPASLGNLANLQELWLYDTYRATEAGEFISAITGAIPSELGNLSNLRYLYLTENQLSGAIPSELGSLTKLEDLNLTGNQLTGAIPSELGSLTKLLSLSIQSNQLTGAIPAELNSLTELTSLALSSNQLTGTIPDLSGLTKLAELDFTANDLSGAIPASLGDLTSLAYLTLDGNLLTGIPGELGDLTSLVFLDIANNMLSGAIPSELGNLINLEILRLDDDTFPDTRGDNQLSGAIPSELGNLSNLRHLYLSRNQLSGAIPSELGSLTSLIDLRIDENQLSGAIPSELGEPA